MSKSKVFVGPRDSGKTKKAMEIYNQLNSERPKSCVFLNGRNKNSFDNPFVFSECTEDTTTIIIDDVPKGFHWSLFASFIILGVRVHRQCEKHIHIHPTFIFTTNHKPHWVDNGESWMRRFEVEYFNTL